MDNVGEKLFHAALEATSHVGDASIADIKRLARAMHTEVRQSSAWGDARARLYMALEVGLRQWIKNNPPGQKYDEHQIDMPRYGYEEEILPKLRDDDVAYRTVNEVLNVNGPTLVRVTKTVFAQLRSKTRGGDKDRVTARFPEYPKLLKEIVQAKKAWTVSDVAIRKTDRFRMMGGLARITSEKISYDRLIDEAHRLEKLVLGKVLTSRTRVS
jgi:hypothetical protein